MATLHVINPANRAYLAKNAPKPAEKPAENEAVRIARWNDAYLARVHAERRRETAIGKASKNEARRNGQHIKPRKEQRIYKSGERFLFGVFDVDAAAPLLYPVCHDGETRRGYVPADLNAAILETFLHSNPWLNDTAWEKPATPYNDMIDARFDIAICMDFLNGLEARGNDDAATIRREYLRGALECNVDFADLLQELRAALWEAFKSGRATWDADGFQVLDADVSAVWRDIYGAMSSYLWKHRTRQYKRLYVPADDETLVSIGDRIKWAEKSSIDALLSSETITTFFQYIRDNSRNADALIKTAKLLINGYTYADAARMLGLKSVSGIQTRQKALHTLYTACFGARHAVKPRETWEKTADGVDRRPRYADAATIAADAARIMVEYRNTSNAEHVAAYTLA